MVKLPTVLIVGLGSIGIRHLRNLRQLGDFRVIACRSGQGLLPDGDCLGIELEYDLSQALAQKPVMAFITNPTALHLEVAIPCAEAGCHLFIEKPLAHRLSGCDALARIVRRNNLVSMISCQFRFHPLLRSLKNQLAAGRIGNVIGARAEWGEYLPDWHPGEDYRNGYSARHELGGGVGLSLIHPVDYLYWLFGPTLKTQAMISQIPSLATDVEDDYLEMTLRHSLGVISQVHLDFIQRPPVHTLTVWGDAGKARWDYHAGLLSWEDTSGCILQEKIPETFERNDLFLKELSHFISCVEQSRETLIPLAEGIAVLKIVLAALGREGLE